MRIYYNENNEEASKLLRRAMENGLIAQGVIDTRSIEDVRANDLAGYDQCHFFAGIGVWQHALRKAGWADDEPVWTGSCPCQPFSSIGRRKGFKDARHLWPEFYRLISQCRPVVCFGEQVASNDGLNWLDTVSSDMESQNYAFGAVDTCAAGFGAPHIRQRLFWVGYADSYRWPKTRPSIDPSRNDGSVGKGSATSTERFPGPTNGFWADADWLRCRDGKQRPVEPGTFPLADGVVNRVEILKAYGNSLVLQQAVGFIHAFTGSNLKR